MYSGNLSKCHKSLPVWWLSQLCHNDRILSLSFFFLIKSLEKKGEDDRSTQLPIYGNKKQDFSLLYLSYLNWKTIVEGTLALGWGNWWLDQSQGLGSRGAGHPFVCRYEIMITLAFLLLVTQVRVHNEVSPWSTCLILGMIFYTGLRCSCVF